MDILGKPVRVEVEGIAYRGTLHGLTMDVAATNHVDICGRRYSVPTGNIMYLEVHNVEELTLIEPDEEDIEPMSDTTAKAEDWGMY